MSNTIKTLAAGDITRKALAILHNNLVFCKTINREYDDRFARSGAKNGGTLIIRNPNQFTVRSGATMDTQDVTENTQTLTVATQLGVDINFSSVELTLSLDDFAERILQPAMSRLAAEVEKTVITAVYPLVANFENTTFGTKPVLADVLLSRAILSKNLAPSSDRFCLVDSLAANSVITAGYNIFNPANEISKQYETGLLGNVYGFTFKESEMTPTHTNGSRTDTTPTTSTVITDGTATWTIAANASTTTYLAGDVLTIAGIYEVNPETKVAYDYLKQWAVISYTSTATSAGTLTLSPTPYHETTEARQNCSVVTSSTTAAIVNLTNTSTGGSGSASTAHINSLAYHKDAFTMVTADLEMPQGVDFAARKVIDNISLRIVRQYDVVNDRFPCRIDVLFGQLATRPQWACRICS